ncbi:hypothetical protein AC1031_021910 [Aphanomyces cochlioides]|nr:hypothetical protein AC1031_021910 [Aphanomyces cochlioides]
MRLEEQSMTRARREAYAQPRFLVEELLHLLDKGRVLADSLSEMLVFLESSVLLGQFTLCCLSPRRQNFWRRPFDSRLSSSQESRQVVDLLPQLANFFLLANVRWLSLLAFNRSCLAVVCALGCRLWSSSVGHGSHTVASSCCSCSSVAMSKCKSSSHVRSVLFVILSCGLSI